MPKILNCILLLFLTISISCNSKKNINKKEKYYTSGVIKESGNYLNDSFPIGIVWSFYENGKVKSCVTYDSVGILNGPSSHYYNNGNLKQKLYYVHNLANGEIVDYDSIGNPLQKGFFFHDMLVGERCSFKNNKVNYYAFYDFSDHKLNHIEYDSLGRVVKNIRNCIFYDSTIIKKKLEDSILCKTSLLISNPPRVSNNIIITYVLENNQIIQVDTLKNSYLPFVYQSHIFPNSLKYISIAAKQYDSILSKTIFQNETIKIK